MRLRRVLASLTALCLLWSGNTVAAQTWRGLRVAPTSRCSPYLASDYSYPQSIEAQIVESLGGIWSPYTGRTFSSRRDTDIEHRGGPRNSDSLLRWNPDQGEGVWHATEETKLSG